MAMNPLPPQAYTKETLQKAYQWLLTQNSSIKEMAANQEILVSLYLKAQRNGDAYLETPSIQNFKQELKSLANMMGDFQIPTSATLPNHKKIESKSDDIHFSQNTIKDLPKSEFDSMTLAALQDVKSTLNLSSESEALRALVAIGYRHFKKQNN